MPAIGIDLGTTYSCVAAFIRDKIEVIANDHGNRTTPSYVSFSDTERLIGEPAKEQESMNIDGTVFQIKRLMGRTCDDPTVLKDKALWGFKVINDENKPNIEVKFKGKTMTFCPEEISSIILSMMKETAEDYIGESVSDAVITVPAYFNDAQRRATRDAGTIAGLNVLAMISEPTAAAIAYGLERGDEEKRTVLIFDLGGGTFDVTILTIEDGSFDVKAIGGDDHLGGEDFSNAIFHHCAEEFRRETKLDIKTNKRAISRLRKAAELAKKNLSSAAQTKIQVEALYDGRDFSTSLTRSRFEQMNSRLFNQTIATVKNTMRDARLTTAQIDDVVLVGGSTRIPKIRELLEDYFDKELLKSINPDEAVAFGAAAHAASLSPSGNSKMKKFNLSDVTPLSLGIETRDSDMAVVVPRNTKIPTKRSHNFTTLHDNQTTVLFPVYEGERPCTDDNHHLGSFRLRDIPPLPKGEASIDVCFEIDEAGILTVTAAYASTGKIANIVIANDKGRLNQREINRMLSDAQKFKNEDEKWRKRTAVLNKVEKFVYNVRQNVQNQKARRNLSLSERNEVLNKCAEMIEWLTANQASASIETLESKQAELESVCNPIFAKLYMMN